MVNKLKWGTFSLIATLIFALVFSPVASFAATTNTTSTSSLMDSIFKRVGLEVPNRIPKGDRGSEGSDPSEQEPPKEDEGSDSNEEDQNHPDPNPDPGNDETDTPQPDDQDGTSPLADQIIATGKKYLGTPYQYGAPSGQTKTFDCSSFVQQVFQENGIDLPRSSRQQYGVGKSVAKSELKKGDLLFFTTSSSNGQIGHVGIYAGNHTILHTWGPGGVKFESLDKRWLQQGYVGAKRVISE